MSSAKSTKRLIILNQHEIFKKDSGALNVVKLKHPKTANFHPFLVVDSQLYELVNYHQELGTVFIDNYCQAECPTYFASKFNLIYFLISQCYATSSTYVSAEKILENLLESCSDKDLLKTLEMPKNLDTLFDTKAKDSEIKFNQDKCIKWLSKKVTLLEALLTKKANNAALETKSKVKVDPGTSKVEAFELIGQYLNKNLASLLRKELKLASPLDTNDNNKMSKRVKTEEVKEEPAPINQETTIIQ